MKSLITCDLSEVTFGQILEATGGQVEAIEAIAEGIGFDYGVVSDVVDVFYQRSLTVEQILRRCRLVQEMEQEISSWQQ